MPFFQNANSINAPSGHYHDASHNKPIEINIHIGHSRAESTIRSALTDALQNQLESNTQSIAGDIIDSEDHRSPSSLSCGSYRPQSAPVYPTLGASGRPRSDSLVTVVKRLASQPPQESTSGPRPLSISPVKSAPNAISGSIIYDNCKSYTHSFIDGEIDSEHYRGSSQCDSYTSGVWPQLTGVSVYPTQDVLNPPRGDSPVKVVEPVSLPPQMSRPLPILPVKSIPNRTSRSPTYGDPESYNHFDSKIYSGHYRGSLRYNSYASSPGPQSAPSYHTLGVPGPPRDDFPVTMEPASRQAPMSTSRPLPVLPLGKTSRSPAYDHQISRLNSTASVPLPFQRRPAMNSHIHRERATIFNPAQATAACQYDSHGRLEGLETKLTNSSGSIRGTDIVASRAVHQRSRSDATTSSLNGPGAGGFHNQLPDTSMHGYPMQDHSFHSQTSAERHFQTWMQSESQLQSYSPFTESQLQPHWQPLPDERLPIGPQSSLSPKNYFGDSQQQSRVTTRLPATESPPNAQRNSKSGNVTVVCWIGKVVGGIICGSK